MSELNDAAARAIELPTAATMSAASTADTAPPLAIASVGPDIATSTSTTIAHKKAALARRRSNTSEERVDERGQWRGLRQDDERSDEEQRNDRREQCPSSPLPQHPEELTHHARSALQMTTSAAYLGGGNIA